jgi:hypothetical protein
VNTASQAIQPLRAWLEMNRKRSENTVTPFHSEIGNKAPSLSEDAWESSTMAAEIASNWASDWLWGLPLIVLNVVIHAYVLGLMNKKITSKQSSELRLWEFSAASIFVVGGAVLCVTILHAFEGAIWAISYRLLGALQDNKSAMLYSLNAITTYGHENIKLEPRWQMMGALEALNGCIMFGLTTAFLFTVMQKAWPRT